MAIGNAVEKAGWIFLYEARGNQKNKVSAP
jgi:hypothetical protein